MSEWEAEIDIDGLLVRRVLGEQFPELASRSIRSFATGWDNSVWLIDDRLVFRFPRRRMGLPGIEREVAVLPRLAPRLPLPIPNPSHVGRPGRHFPWPFFGAPIVSGREPAQAGLDAGGKAVGAGLGRFLRVLHDDANLTDFKDDLPIDPMSRGDMSVRVPRTRQQLAAVQSAGMWSAPPSVADVLARAESLAPSRHLALAHGDLHVRHILLDYDGYVSGVIDWGDVCIADPAVDLSLYWSFLDDAGRRAFVDEYGPIEPDGLLRARVLALFLNASLALYAADVGNAPLVKQSLAGLERSMAPA